LIAAAAPHHDDVRLRPATAGDAGLLFDWLNAPDSIAASLDTRVPVAWDSHCRWLAERLADPAAQVWIVEVDGRTAGQVRLQDKGDGPEVALYVVGWVRGRGIAQAALADALAAGSHAWPGARAIARVRHDNPASRRLFERCGFTVFRTAADHDVLVRPL
jgi:RimJ/RimL family protein N-acetyltransferase